MTADRRSQPGGRGDAGVAPLKLTSIWLDEFLPAAVSQAGLWAPATRFVLEPIGDLPPLCADEMRLHQAFANLLDNAAKDGPPDGMVSVRVRRRTGTTEFEVTDQGPGIAPEQRERVFERFTRGDRAVRDGGTGLGLAIAQWVIQMHHGTIAIVDPDYDGAAAARPAGYGPGCRVRISLHDLGTVAAPSTTIPIPIRPIRRLP